MDKEYYQFNLSKSTTIYILVLFVLAIILAIFSPFFMELQPKIQIARILIPPVYILFIIIFIGMSSFNKPYIEITPLFIKQGSNKLFWRDITGVKIVKYHFRLFYTWRELRFATKDPSKCKKRLGTPYFSIRLDGLSKGDQEKLKSIIQKRFPKSRLD